MSKKTIGIVGGGQLCLMLGQALHESKMDYDLVALDPTEHCPAYPVLKKQILGDFRDEKKLRELASYSDIITFEIELADSDTLSTFEKEGKPLHPSSTVLRTVQDKLTQSEFLKKHHIPLPDSLPVSSEQDIAEAIEKLGLPLMIKSRKDSYDGRGNFVIRSKEDISKAISLFSGQIMAQQFITFDLEVSVMCAKGINGEIVTFPVAENIHGVDYHILHKSIVPARIDEEMKAKARKIAIDAVSALDGVGIFGVELLVAGKHIFVNEIAPRVHNTGHYSIEGCDTSQFLCHLQAVTGVTLSTPSLVVDSVVMHNIIGTTEGPYKILYGEKVINKTVEIETGAYVHHYGKLLSKEKRKLGHLTVLAQAGETQEELIERAQQLFDKITIQ